MESDIQNFRETTTYIIFSFVDRWEKVSAMFLYSLFQIIFWNKFVRCRLEQRGCCSEAHFERGQQWGVGYSKTKRIRFCYNSMKINVYCSQWSREETKLYCNIAKVTMVESKHKFNFFVNFFILRCENGSYLIAFQLIQ